MHIDDLATASRLVRSWQESSRKTGRRLARANALLRRAERALHDLPDSYCPLTLLGEIRLHLHREQADTSSPTAPLGEPMFDSNPRRLDGPDFLHAVADAEESNGNLINAAEYRRRAVEWQRERQAMPAIKPRIRVPASRVMA